MVRVLIVTHEPVVASMLWERVERASADAAVAICHVLESGTLSGEVAAQRQISGLLRAGLADRAERIAVFVAFESGYTVDDCARDWDATDVWT